MATLGHVARQSVMVSADLIARYELLRSQLDARFELLGAEAALLDDEAFKR